MAEYAIIVVGASAGGVEALTELVKGFTPDFPAAIFIVLHVSPHGTSALPQILSRSGPLPAVHPDDAQAIQPGKIYVAPPDHHLLLKHGYMTLARGPKENGHRPAIDPLFRTAARHYGHRVIGVVLSGVLDDGTAGLLAVKMRGGRAVVQDPDDALYANMPRSAIENVGVDQVLPIAEMANVLAQLAHEVIMVEQQEPSVSDEMETETDIAELDNPTIHNEHRAGTPSVFACPECGGTLWEIEEGDLVRFRCRVGHAFSAQTLMAEQADALEETLWVALRALEENAALSRKLADRATTRGNTLSAQRFEERAENAVQHAELIRRVILNGSLQVSGEDVPESDENTA